MYDYYRHDKIKLNKTWCKTLKCDKDDIHHCENGDGMCKYYRERRAKEWIIKKIEGFYSQKEHREIRITQDDWKKLKKIIRSKRWVDAL